MKYNFDEYYNRSNTNAEKYTLREELFGKKDVLPLWVADMDIATPSFVLNDIKKRLNHPILGYEEFPQKAKKALKNWIKTNHNYKIKNSWISYCHSVVTSINIAIQAFSNENDEILVPSPVYFPFFSSVKNNNRKLVKTSLIKKDENYTFDFDDLVSKITPKTKLILLCSPHNPLSLVWKKEELEKLADICLKNGIKIFSDEIHSDLVYKPYKHIPTASLSKKIENITITSYGVGKTFNLAGVATSAVVIANKELREKFNKKANEFHLAQGNIFGHIAFYSAYKKGRVWKDELLVYLEKNISKLKKLEKKHSNLISISPIQATYLAWIDCKGMNLSDKQLKEFFVHKANLGLSPGVLFGKEGTRYIRLNFAVPSKIMHKAIKQLDSALTNFKQIKN